MRGLVREDGSVWSSGVTSKDRSTTFVQVIASDATYAAAGECVSVSVFVSV